VKEGTQLYFNCIQAVGTGSDCKEQRCVFIQVHSWLC